MKTKITSLAMALLFPVMLWAQVPQAITYQAVARDAQGNALKNQSISLRVSIKNTSSGAAVYQETQTGFTTNQFGLFTIEIGNGIAVSGTFSAIDWSTGSKYIKIEFDPNGGSTYSDMGTTQLLSVPFALYAGKAGSGGSSVSALSDLTDVNTAGVTNNQVLRWNGTEWTPATLTDNDNQTLSIAGTQLTISGGNSVTLPAGGSADNWGTDVVHANAPLTGNGTSGSPLKITSGSSNGQVLTWNGTAWAAASPTGGTNYTGGTGISVNGSSIINTAPDQTVVINGGGNTTVTGTYPNFTVSTPAQALSINGSTVSLSNGGGSISLPSANSFTLPYSNTVNSASTLFDIANSGSGSTGKFVNSGSGNTNNALTGQSAGTGYGVYGANTRSSGSGMAGVYGTYSSSAHGAGVIGIGSKGTLADVTSSSLNIGVFGSADSIGVLGDVPANNNGVGVYGASDYVGTWGNNFSTAIGSRLFLYDATAVGGYFGSTGGQGSYSVASGTDLFNSNYVTNGAVNLALSEDADFNVGTLSYGFGLGSTGSATGIQAYGDGNAADVIGIYARALSTGTSHTYAGYMDGALYVNGMLSKGGGTFMIDHPLDPANKFLYHSFVESPDMMNIYNGNVTTDANGDAIVTLPDYFETLNKDFRYQLTVIGSFAQAMVAEKVSNNQFKIKTNQPGIEVSWQVTGIRQDPFANANRVVPEVNKKGKEIGRYLHPELYGKTAKESMSALFSPLALENSSSITPRLPKMGLLGKAKK